MGTNFRERKWVSDRGVGIAPRDGLRDKGGEARTYSTRQPLSSAEWVQPRLGAEGPAHRDFEVVLLACVSSCWG